MKVTLIPVRDRASMSLPLILLLDVELGRTLVAAQPQLDVARLVQLAAEALFLLLGLIFHLLFHRLLRVQVVACFPFPGLGQTFRHTAIFQIRMDFL
jgi:hypothetical protein